MTQYEKYTINSLIKVNTNLVILAKKFDNFGAHFASNKEQISDDSMTDLPKIKTFEQLEQLETNLSEEVYRKKLVSSYLVYLSDIPFFRFRTFTLAISFSNFLNVYI